jgi:DNA-binding beta-propeller fold protein YncE
VSDNVRPDAAISTQLSSSIDENDDVIPVLTTAGFNPQAKKRFRDRGEIVRCAGMRSDPSPAFTGCLRGLSYEEGGTTPQPHESGEMITELPWTSAEVVTEIPIPDESMVGRLMVFKPTESDAYAFNVGLKEDGELRIEWINEPPPDEEPAITFAWSEEITGLDDVYGVSLDSLSNLYLTDRRFDGPYIVKYNPSGILQWQQRFDGVSVYRQVFADVSSVYFTDAPETFWVGEGLSGFAPSILRTNLTTGTPMFGVGDAVTLERPEGVTGDGVNIWFTDKNKGTIFVTELSTTTITEVVTGLEIPTGGITYRDGKLYVVLHGAIHVYNATTYVLEQVFAVGAGNLPGQISGAHGIAIDAVGRIWVSDTGNHRINVYDAAGVFIAEFGEHGSGNGQFLRPHQIAFNPIGTVAYIADEGNGRVVSLRVVPSDLLKLGFDAYAWDEEFIGGGTASGTIGERGWLFNGNGSVSLQASTAANPGMISVSSGASSGNSSRITLGPWVLPQIDKMLFIFLPAGNGVTGSMRQGAGMGVALNGSSPVDGVAVERETGDANNNLYFAKYAASVMTRVDTEIPFVSNRQYLFQIVKVGPGTVEVTLRDMFTGQEAVHTFTGISESAQMDASFFTRTSNNSNKTIIPDYWSGSFSGLTRA